MINTPATELTIPSSAIIGDFIGAWQQFSSFTAGKQFVMCALPKANAQNIGSDERLYAIGEKPSATDPSGQSVSDGGTSWPVFTTEDLQIHGLGYILRWRTVLRSGSNGPWRSPNSTWPTDTDPGISSHPRFYQGHFSPSNCFGTGFGAKLNGFASFQEWTTYLATSPGTCFYFLYGVELEFRYVMIENAANAQLDSSTATQTIELAVFNSRPQASHPLKGTVQQTITIRYPPWGTCTTGNVVRSLYANQGELVNDGDTSTPMPFEIKLTNCPRVNIGYSFVAPGGIGFDSATGVIDLDSTAGNAQGVGIQIRHRNDPVYVNNTIVFNPSDYITNPSYVRNWPQCESNGTCINNSSTGVNHTIPMQAAVYRKGTISPGSINASLLFHIVYP